MLAWMSSTVIFYRIFETGSLTSLTREVDKQSPGDPAVSSLPEQGLQIPMPTLLSFYVSAGPLSSVPHA